jgi:hypothetical protein
VGFRFIARLEGRVLEIDEFAAEDEMEQLRLTAV